MGPSKRTEGEFSIFPSLERSLEKSPMLSCGNLKFIRRSKTGQDLSSATLTRCHQFSFLGNDGIQVPFLALQRCQQKEVITICIRLLTHPNLDPVILSAFNPSLCFNFSHQVTATICGNIKQPGKSKTKEKNKTKPKSRELARTGVTVPTLILEMKQQTWQHTGIVPK